MDSVYRLEGSRVLTGPMAGGPWDPKLQHGSAPSALIVAVAEAVPTAAPMRVARLTVDLMRPIPVAPLEIKTEVLREGRKIQLCNIDLIADGKLCVRGTVLNIRRESFELPDTVKAEPVTLPPPEAGRIAEGKITENPFMACLNMSVVKGGFNRPGPGAVWFRVDRPIIEGSPTLRPCGRLSRPISATAPRRCWISAPGPSSMAICRSTLRAIRSATGFCSTRKPGLGRTAAGIACAKLADSQGYFGRAAQSILIEPRGR